MKLRNIFKEYFLKVSTVLILCFIPIIPFNPHYILLNPMGYPTSLDYLPLGGFLLLSLLMFFIINNLIQISIINDLKRSSINFFLIFLALVASELIHELGHAFFVIISGGQLTSFLPFPIIIAGELNAGYVGWEAVPSSWIPIVLLGGEIFQWIFLIIGLITLRYKKFRREIQYFFYILLIIAWLDFPFYTINNMLRLPHWFLIGSSQGDIIQFSYFTGISIWIMLILAIIQLSIGIYIFSSRYLKEEAIIRPNKK